ncbi:lipid II:glycine glycyltransferase FemX [Nanoarchaeota archaeon]
MDKYQISILTEEDYEEYKRFLKENKESLYEHSLEVKELVSKYFKFKPKYLIAKENNKIVGALPLFEAKSLIQGKRLVSIPFFPYGGVIGECKKGLLETAKELSKDVKFLQIRQRNGLEPELEKDFVRQAPILDFLVNLTESPEEMWASLKRDVRKNIKKAKKNGLKFELGRNKKELDDFYDIYLNTRKKRGVPAWPKGLFEEALKSHDSLIGLVYQKDKPIAAGFFSFYNKEIVYGFSGADYNKINLCPYHLLVWNMCRYGIKKGYTVLDYGPTTKEMNDGGLFDFKSRWCDEHNELPYYFYAANKENVPALQNDFKLYKLYGKIWSRLPKWVINKISPFIIRQFS